MTEYDYEWHVNEYKNKSTYTLMKALQSNLEGYEKFKNEDPTWREGKMQLDEMEILRNILKKRGVEYKVNIEVKKL